MHVMFSPKPISASKLHGDVCRRGNGAEFVVKRAVEVVFVSHSQAEIHADFEYGSFFDADFGSQSGVNRYIPRRDFVGYTVGSFVQQIIRSAVKFPKEIIVGAGKEIVPERRADHPERFECAFPQGYRKTRRNGDFDGMDGQVGAKQRLVQFGNVQHRIVFGVEQARIQHRAAFVRVFERRARREPIVEPVFARKTQNKRDPRIAQHIQMVMRDVSCSRTDFCADPEFRRVDRVGVCFADA